MNTKNITFIKEISDKTPEKLPTWIRENYYNRMSATSKSDTKDLYEWLGCSQDRQGNKTCQIDNILKVEGSVGNPEIRFITGARQLKYKEEEGKIKKTVVDKEITLPSYEYFISAGRDGGDVENSKKVINNWFESNSKSEKNEVFFDDFKSCTIGVDGVKGYSVGITIRSIECK